MANPACKVYKAIQTHGLKRLMDHWGLSSAVSPAAVSLVMALLDENPYSRASMDQALAHPWLADAVATEAAAAKARHKRKVSCEESDAAASTVTPGTPDVDMR